MSQTNPGPQDGPETEQPVTASDADTTPTHPGSPEENPSTSMDSAEDDPDREGEDRFDAG